MTTPSLADALAGTPPAVLPADPPAGLPDPRDSRRSMRRGWSRQCPACGKGALFTGFLRVRDACPACGEHLHHHRADDGPAYFTILIVGHLLAPLLMLVYFRFHPHPLVMAAGFSAGCIGLSLWLLPRIKGLIVGLQWAKRMHGFGTGEPASDV